MLHHLAQYFDNNPEINREEGEEEKCRRPFTKAQLRREEDKVKSIVICGGRSFYRSESYTPLHSSQDVRPRRPQSAIHFTAIATDRGA